MACFALLPRTRLYCSNCGENVDTERITGLICGRKSGGCAEFDFPPSLRASDRRHLAWQSVLLNVLRLRCAYYGEYGLPHQCAHWFAMTVKNPTFRNHPTSDKKLRWLFIKCQRFRRTWSSTIESVEAVRAPRALLPAMLCISVRAKHATDGPKSR